MIKEIIKGESIRTCDVCGNKIDYEKILVVLVI